MVLGAYNRLRAPLADDGMWAPFLWLGGARRFTSGLANVPPRPAFQMFEALQADDFARVIEVWLRIKPFEDLRARGNNANNVSLRSRSIGTARTMRTHSPSADQRIGREREGAGAQDFGAVASFRNGSGRTMKIEQLRLYPIAVSRQTGVVNQHVIVQLRTDEGAIGWGEMSDLSHLPMYQFDIPELERSLNALLRGKDAQNVVLIEDELLKYYPDEGHMYSRSGLVRQGVDLAVHDLLGKSQGMPAYMLLGGKLRERIKVCYPIFRMRSVQEVGPNLARVQGKLDEGFDLIRMYVGANPEADELFLKKFQEQFQGKVAIKSLDFSNLLDWRRAWQLSERYARIVDYMLIESPAPRNDLEGLGEIRRRSRVPISEHVLHLQHGWQLLHHGAVDILNVSPYLLGGLRASLRLIAIAEAARASVLIGTTQELNLGTAAVAHLGAAARVLDYACDSTGPRLYTTDVVHEPVRYEAGYLEVPEAPGLGLEIDEARLQELTESAHWTFRGDLAGAIDRTANPA